jgi:hypothetical protein
MTRMWVRHALAAAVLGVSVLTGTAPGTASSAASYRTALNAACASSYAFTQSLPELQQQKHLSVHQLQLLADQHAAEFRTTVSGLSPPINLTAAHLRLLADLVHPPVDTKAALTSFARTLLKDYQAVGASGCASYERQALASLARLHS